MNAFVEYAVIGLLVAGAAAYAVSRLVRIVQGKKPSCCSDDDVPHRTTKPSGCAGCTGCDPVGR